MLKMFTIDSKRTIIRGAAAFCAASFLTACAPAGAIETPPQVTSLPTVEMPLASEEATPFETGAAAPSEAGTTAPAGEFLEETVGLSELIEESSIQIKSFDGEIGDYSFFACNETQVFGDYSIVQASYQGEDYLMLSYNGVALLAKEDGSDAKLFYEGARLDLPFSCNFNIEYKYLGLYEGDFTGAGSRQLALVIPVETGSGVDIEELRVVDLETLSLIPMYTDEDGYEESIYALFEGHFAETGMQREYYLFDYVQYEIRDDHILARYGACDEDDLYLSFLTGSLQFEEGALILAPKVSFQDEL